MGAVRGKVTTTDLARHDVSVAHGASMRTGIYCRCIL